MRATVSGLLAGFGLAALAVLCGCRGGAIAKLVAERVAGEAAVERVAAEAAASKASQSVATRSLVGVEAREALPDAFAASPKHDGAFSEEAKHFFEHHAASEGAKHMLEYGMKS